MTGIRDYSTTADANLAVAGISLAEGMARASVNNAMRAGMADLADLLLDMGGSKHTTGTASAYLVDLDSEPTAYSDNMLFLATAHVGNAAGATININSIGTKPIKTTRGGLDLAIAAEAFPAGHIGIFTYSSSKNAVILLNQALSSAAEFDTVAEMLAWPGPADGEGTVWRADGFRYREADPAATDHHLTTAGGVKLYVQPGDDGWYNFRAMDPVMDNVAGEVVNADKLNKLLLIRPTGGQDAGNPAWPQGPSIQIPMGHYYFDPGPWGFQLKATTHLRGELCVPAAAPDATVLHIKKDCVGFTVNHYDTYQNTIESGVGPYGEGGAIGSTFEGLWLISQITASGGNPNAHGIWLRTGATVRDCEIQAFNGNGINAVGSGAPDNFTPWFSGITSVTRGHGLSTDENKYYGCWINPGTGSTVKPTHTTPGLTDYPDGYNWYYVDPLLRGGPSHCSFERVTCVGNRHHGLFMEGGDSSACVGISINCYANGRLGIYDSGFLGNTWIGCHSRTNGISGSALNSAIESSVVSLQNGPGGTYNKYMAKWGATEASLVATMPGTDDNVWVAANIGGPNQPLHPFYPVWTPGRPEGTYFVGGGYVADNNNARTMFLGCYQEGDEPYGYLSLTSLAIGGIANWQKGSLSLDAIAGVLTNQTGFSVTDVSNNFIGIGASGTSTPTAFVALSFRTASEAQPWRLQYSSTTGDWDLDYQNAFHAFNITSINTVGKMGTSRTQPYLLHAPTLAIGGAIGGTTTVRRQTTSATKPIAGEWAAGDVVWNTNTATNSYVGWVCTTAGAFGSAWVTGTNYAINAYVLATSGKYYRCSLDPGAGLSTVEPSHASGEVIGADGYGWTFVASTAVEFLPFGQTIDLFEHTTLAVLALSALTHPRIIIHNSATAITTSASITLSTTGAFRGANFRITRKTGGVGVLNVGTGPLKALVEGTWCEVTYDGSAWILTAYGEL